MKLLYKTFFLLFDNLSEILLLCIFIISMLPFFINLHSLMFYISAGWFLGLLSMFSVSLNKKRFYHIAYIGILILGLIGFCIFGMRGFILPVDVLLCLITYFGGLMGMFSGFMIQLLIKSKR